MEGSSAISNDNGELLFYTNGIDVWNRNNIKMPHGTGLFGDQSTTQSAVIIKRPGNNNRYYIFTADDGGGVNGLTYSEVDMTADGGKGDVISANNPLVTPVTEKITAAYHANGKDIWVTTHQWGSNAFYSYKVTSEGVSNTPVISNTGLVIDGANNSGHYAGWMSISPNGSHLAIANGLLAVELFKFDNTTGQVSDPVVLKSPAKCYGVEFSPNSKLLYLTSDDKLFQYQVTAPDVALTQTQVGTIDVASSLKLGPDSRIYVVNKYLAETMSVINSPNVTGTGCNFTLNAIDLGGKQTFVGLPNFITSPFYVLDIDTDVDCSETSVSFTAITTLDSDSVLWDFGDGNSSTNLSVMHTYANSGVYTVKAKAKSGSFVRYYTEDVAVLKAPVALKPADMLTCGSEDGTAIFILSSQNSQILGTQPASHYMVSYHISAQDAETGANPLPDNYTNTANGQTIYARVSLSNADCYAVTSFLLTVAPMPVIDMPESYSFCNGNGITLSAPEGFDSYEWSTGEKTRVIEVSEAGAYTLTVTKATGTIVCEASKEIMVHESWQPVIKDVEIKEWSDDNNEITIVTAFEGDNEYSIDGIAYQDSPVFDGLAPGRYTVYVKNGCGQAEEKIILFTYPKYFTPNGDNVHDTWKIENAYFEPGMIVHIYDRYGKHLASLKNNTPGWDGKFNGADLPSTDYWFVVDRENGKEFKGHFSMLR
jgi:gliding motility-associated-like protein